MEATTMDRESVHVPCFDFDLRPWPSDRDWVALESLFDIKPLDVVTFSVAPLLLLIVALIAC